MTQDINISKTFFKEKTSVEINMAIDRLCRFLAQRDAQKKRKRLVVAIARKGPHFERRIIDYLMSYGLVADFVSDVAIPFVDFSVYDEVIVFDDAIYYGTTFEKVRLLTQLALKNCNLNDRDCDLICWPLVVADKNDGDIIKPKSIINGVETRLDDKMTYIAQDKVPFYVNSVIDIIQAQKVPYDVEVPVFRFSLEHCTFTPEKFVHLFCEDLALTYNIEAELIKHYSTKRYNRSEGNFCETHVVLLNSVFDKYSFLKPDIAKLKLIFDTDSDGFVSEVTFATYCINTISDERLIDGEDLFPYLVLKRIWNALFKPDELLIGFQNEHAADYTIAAKRSLTVLANWIYSVFLGKSVCIILTARLDGFNANIVIEHAVCNGIRLLAGVIDGNKQSKIAKAFVDIDFDVFKAVCFPAVYGARHYLPLPYRVDYEHEWLKLIDANSNNYMTVSLCMSKLFGNMHRCVEVPSRRLEADVFSRLQFGETISSLVKRCKRLSPPERDIDDIYVSMNRELDLRVDAGSVVPTYALQSSAHYSYNWARLFRPGENEDLMRDQFARNFIYLVKKLLRLSDTKSFNTKDFVNNLIILSDNFNIAFSGRQFMPFGLEMYHIWSDDCNEELMMLKLDADNEVDLITYAVDCDVIEQIEGRVYRLNDNYLVKSAADANIFSSEEEQEITKILQGIEVIKRRVLSPFLAAHRLINWYVWNPLLAKNDVESIIDFIESSNSSDKSEYAQCLSGMFYKFISLLPLGDINYQLPVSKDSVCQCMIDYLIQRKNTWAKSIKVFDKISDLLRLSFLMAGRSAGQIKWSDVTNFTMFIPDDFDDKIEVGNNKHSLKEIWNDSILQDAFDAMPDNVLNQLNSLVVNRVKALLSNNLA